MEVIVEQNEYHWGVWVKWRQTKGKSSLPSLALTNSLMPNWQRLPNCTCALCSVPVLANHMPLFNCVELKITFKLILNYSTPQTLPNILTFNCYSFLLKQINISLITNWNIFFNSIVCQFFEFNMESIHWFWEYI